MNRLKILACRNLWYVFDGEVSEQFLYFYADDLNAKISNDRFYKVFVPEGKKGFYNNWYNNVLEEKTFVFIKQKFSFTEFVKSWLDASAVIFQDNLTDAQKKALKKVFNSAKFYPSLSFEILKTYLLKHGRKYSKYVVINALDERVIISGFDLEKSQEAINVKEAGIKVYDDTFVYAITKTVLEDINKIYTKIPAEKYDSEFEVLYEKVRENKSKFKDKEFLTLSIRLIFSGERYLVNLRKDEILRAQELYKRQIASEIKSNLPFGFKETGRIIAVGEIFGDKQFLGYLENFAKKLEIVDLGEVFSGLEKTIEFGEIFKVVDTLKISELSNYRELKLQGFDERPGKGYSLQHFEILDEGVLRVKNSTRSLKPGDIAYPVFTEFKKGEKLRFKIERNGKIIGLFETRKIVRIEVLQKNG